MSVQYADGTKGQSFAENCWGGGGLWKMNVMDGRNTKGLKSQKNHYAGKCTYSEMSFSSEIGSLPYTCKE